MSYIIISIVFYVCVYGVVICLKFCSLNSNFCKIINNLKLIFKIYKKITI